MKAGAKGPDGKELWYKKGIDYWDAVPTTDDGVLGGYGHVSSLDAKENREFLDSIFGDALEEQREGSRKLVACDCGAGIGRVTSSFLIHHFDEVDLVEPVRHFIGKAEELLGPAAPPRGGPQGRQLLRPAPGGIRPRGGALRRRVDPVVRRAPPRRGVRLVFPAVCGGAQARGVVFVKENNAKEGFVLDTEDSSVTRSHKYLMHLFEDEENLGWEVVEHVGCSGISRRSCSRCACTPSVQSRRRDVVDPVHRRFRSASLPRALTFGLRRGRGCSKCV